MQLIVGMTVSVDVDLTISMTGYHEYRHYMMRIYSWFAVGVNKSMRM